MVTESSAFRMNTCSVRPAHQNVIYKHMKLKITYLISSLTFLLSCNSSIEKSTDSFANKQSDNIIFNRTAIDMILYPKSTDSLISKLDNMSSKTLDSSAVTFWMIIKRGQASIPLLIESLTDTTETNIYDNCKKSKLNVGEVSYFALNEIAEFPAFLVTHMQFDVYDNEGCWSFYDYLYNNNYKPTYQAMVRTFYRTNKFKFIEFQKSELTDCYKKYKILGKYKLEE